MRIPMRTDTYLRKVAYIAPSKLVADYGLIYYSKFDDSYITRVGMEADVKFLAKREITENLTHGVGFSPKDNMWYGWSHRAIHGFTIGSTCKKGDCHYRPTSVDDEIEDALLFWHDEKYHTLTMAKRIAYDKLRIYFIYSNKVPNKKLRSQIGAVDHYFNPNNFGKGEWVAETMQDAYQMACDFSEGVS